MEVEISALGKTRVFEFKPGHAYLILCDGKNFNYELAYALLHKLEDVGVDFTIHIVGTLHPKGIEIHSAEKPEGDKK